VSMQPSKHLQWNHFVSVIIRNLVLFNPTIISPTHLIPGNGYPKISFKVTGTLRMIMAMYENNVEIRRGGYFSNSAILDRYGLPGFRGLRAGKESSSLDNLSSSASELRSLIFSSSSSLGDFLIF